MAVNNVRMLIGFKHELECCPAEKGKAFRIIIITIKDSAVKKVMFRMSIYEKTFTPMDKPEKYGTVNPLVIIWNPQVIVNFLKRVNLVIPHAVVFRKDDLNVVAPDLKFTAESVYHICKSADLGNRCTF